MIIYPSVGILVSKKICKGKGNNKLIVKKLLKKIISVMLNIFTELQKIVQKTCIIISQFDEEFEIIIKVNFNLLKLLGVTDAMFVYV